ncbi:MAG: hypothetical protein HY043_09770 [Verrucomicrobia bacterium]|nr:hypothetical protein [Verrucomicrobiota bacterium]
MKIDPNTNVGRVDQPSVRLSAQAAVRPAEGGTDFDQTSALNQALAQSPAVRADEVARAKELVKDPGYPPPYAMTRIAKLLGIHLSSDGK